MDNKKSETQNRETLVNLSKKEILLKLEESQAETHKYINKFLESQEKWAFLNFLLKELNSIRDKQRLCDTVCSGFSRLTNSNLCACNLFDVDENHIAFSAVQFSKNFLNQLEYLDFIEKINASCINFLEKSVSLKEIYLYFDSICTENIIVLPITLNGNFLGYLILAKEGSEFYKENIHFVNSFIEHIALILENISFYLESEKRNRMKMEFLAGISHEFKTPLNAIIGFSEILKAKANSLQHYKHIDNIHQSATHLLSLIEDILDVSKTGLQKTLPSYSKFNTKEEILQIINASEGMIKEKDIKLKFTLCDVKICADVKRFRQLIYNLLHNAIKFNKQQGGINIISYSENNRFFFEIEDTGDGISKNDFNKIFDFFSQVNRSELKRKLGSGIGLALCKMIVQMHGGEINFKSQLGKGSCFWFALPLEKNSQA